MNRIDDVDNYPLRCLADIAPAECNYRGELNFDNVVFGYNQSGGPLLEGINFCVARGQKTAIAGATGCGKSTLLKLVAGLYEPWEGCIRYDGRTIDEWNRDQLFAGIGFVSQKKMFFSGTVTENITVFDKTIPFEKVVAAARQACIHDFIMTLPDGYNSYIQEGGSNLSGGQRQRLEIARALCRDIALLLFDEATSALDSVTEQRIWDNICRRGITVLAVAHRVNTIRLYDEIIMLDEGKIAEQGTHASLLENNGKYSRLVANQEAEVTDHE